MTLATGTKLGPYEVVSALGAGGMGEVYRARDTRLERAVAIKILPQHLSNDPVRKQQFEREAKTISSLNHPHICVLHDVGSQDGVDYLVMECVEGETLAKRLEKGPLPLDQVLKYGAQIADALDKAHRSGVVHRDLKPGNIMLTATGAKLLDFGLAKPAAPLTSAAMLTAVTQDSPVTEQGTIVGTFQYMSPEQVEGKELDGRSDIFSLGAVLYEMLTGQRAFEGKSHLSVASAILEKEPVPITSAKPMTQPALDHAIRRCLAKDPEERWQTARDLALELKWITESGAQGVISAAISLGSKTRDRVAWTFTVVAASIAAVLLAITTGVLLLRKEPPRPAVYASIVPPAGTNFQLEGDLGIPPVLAPDGSAVIFGAGDAVWYRSLQDGSERMLSKANNEVYPFWSPDSKSIGFFGDGKLKTMDINGGAVKTLCDASNPRGGTWGNTGIILFTPTTRDVIYQIPAGGGTPKPVTQLDVKLHSTHRWPVFLPDGRNFIYMAANHIQPQGEQNGIYIASLDGKVNRPLISTLAGAQVSSGRIFYVKESKLMVQTLDTKTLSVSDSPFAIAENVVVDIGVWHATFSVSEADTLLYQTGTSAGRSRLEWVDRTGKHLGFATDAGTFFGPKLSKDGARILVVAGDPGGDVWELDSSGQRKTRMTFDGMSTSEAVWSPDEKRFVYGQGRPGRHFTINMKASSGTGAVQTVEETSDTDSPTDWSPDGRHLLCERFVNGASQVWVVDSQGKEPSRAFGVSQTTPSLDSSGQFSPDGKWVAFVRSTAGPQIYVMPFPSGNGMWQVSAEGGRWPRWKRDGRELYFASMRNEMMAVRIGEKGDGLDVGQPERLFTFRPALRIFRQGMIGYDVSPDGKRFLLNAAVDENTRPITLVVNWSAELKKK